jgi:predicted transcriptional regulator
MALVSKRLKARREALGLSCEDLASRSGTVHELIEQLDEGTLTDLDVSTLHAICRSMGLSMETVFAIEPGN